MNARSVKNKAVHISDSLQSKNIKVCALTETWLCSSDGYTIKEYYDLGYDLLHKPRSSGKSGGGVGFLVKRGFDVKKINNCSYNSFELFEILLACKNEKYSLSSFYRTGVLNCSTKDSFLEDIEKYVSTKILIQEKIILMGDFNIHVENQNDTFVEEFLDLMKSMGFDQIVHTPTHKLGGTLDLIFVRDLKIVKNIMVYNELNDFVLSDHFLIEMSVNCTPKRKIERFERTFRSISTIDINQFSQELNNSLVAGFEMPMEDQVRHMFSTTHKLLDKYAPVQNKSSVISTKPFFNIGISDAKRVKRRAERRYQKSGSEQDKHDLVVAARNLSKVVKLKSNEFYCGKLQAVQGDAKGTYNIINRLLNKSKKSIYPDNIDPEKLAQEFETFFCDRIENMCQKMNCTPCLSQTNNSTSVMEKFDIVTDADLHEILKTVKTKFSTVDDIPTELIKPIINCSSASLLNIVNSSMQSGIFPNYLKQAHVIPVPKANFSDSNIISSCRPIVNISIVSKIIEKCVYLQVQNHLVKNDLLIVNQSAYRKNHSTETALLKICNDVLETLDSSKNIIVALLDYSAAFDTINHRILLEKLENQYGIKGIV